MVDFVGVGGPLVCCDEWTFVCGDVRLWNSEVSNGRGFGWRITDDLVSESDWDQSIVVEEGSCSLLR